MRNVWGSDVCEKIFGGQRFVVARQRSVEERIRAEQRRSVALQGINNQNRALSFIVYVSLEIQSPLCSRTFLLKQIQKIVCHQTVWEQQCSHTFAARLSNRD